MSPSTHSRLVREYEEEGDDEEEFIFLIGIAAVLFGAEEARLQAIAARNAKRAYLTRPVLLPDPREGTPWWALYRSESDRAFITTMGFDVRTFHFILQAGFEVGWNETRLSRSDNPGTAVPRPGGRSLDAAGALGLTLHYLNSTMREISLQEIFALIPSTVSRYLHHTLPLLLQILRRTPEARIAWPKTLAQYEAYNALIMERHLRLHGAFASIDGLKLLIQESADQDIENASYNGWTASHNTNSVLVFSPEGLYHP